MTEVGFYHLTRTTADQALPRLLGRTLAAGARALVLCGSDERVAALDTALRPSPDPDWLPHGTPRSGEADLQPIWLCAEDPGEAPNGAGFVFLLDGMRTASLARYARAFVLFDGGDEGTVADARSLWTEVRGAGHEAVYWRQGPRGWERAS